MAYDQLVKCSQCGRDISSDAKACPGCGNDVSRELQLMAAEQGKKWEEQGRCQQCGEADFVTKSEAWYDPINRSYNGRQEHAECAACGWKDRLNYIHTDDDGAITYIAGKGLEYGSRTIRKE